ncbi:MAG: hypothetical protein KF833_16875 [Verrucomicrobiae bacterium]|nr:hypothetical protein [Verrucomicrobiae bacterium]
MSLTLEEREEIKRYVIRELPRALVEDRELALVLEGILAEHFPRRDEFARLLDEVQASRRENEARFEALDQRFDAVDHRMDALEQGVKEVRQDLAGVRDWMHLNVGGFLDKAGHRLEDVVAGAFRYGLQRSDIQPEHVQLRRKITDEAGVVFRPGKTREFDLIVLGPTVIVFEVKTPAKIDDIDNLADKVALMRHLHPDKTVDGVFVMLAAGTDHREACAARGLQLIP